MKIKYFKYFVFSLSFLFVSFMLCNQFDFQTTNTSAESTNWSDYVATQKYEGKGTEQEPYLIKTEAELALMSENVYHGIDNDKHFKLVNDLYDIGKYYFRPIGTSNPFTGVFDGNYKTIYGLNVYYWGEAGLFDVIVDAEIKRIRLSEPNIYAYPGLNRYAGGIVGSANNSLIENCVVQDGTVKCSGMAGGIAGRSIGSTKINGSYATELVVESEQADACGVIGREENQQSRIIDTYFVGELKASSGASFGIASIAYEISYCYFVTDSVVFFEENKITESQLKNLNRQDFFGDYYSFGVENINHGFPFFKEFYWHMAV